MDDAPDGGRHRAGPRDGDRDARDRIGWRLACIVGSIACVRCVDILAQLQSDVLRVEREPFEMVFDQLPFIAGNRSRLGDIRLQVIAQC